MESSTMTMALPVGEGALEVRPGDMDQTRINGTPCFYYYYF